MKSPETYADWVVCFEQLIAGTNEEELLLAMEGGRIEWTRGVAERLTERLFETIEAKLKLAAELFDQEIKRTGGDETALVKAVLTMRKRLTLIKKLTDLPAFPQDVRETIFSVLKKYVEDTQQSLEESARADRTGRLRMLFKNNSLLHFDQMELPPTHPATSTNQQSSGSTPAKSMKRRVILQ